MGSGQQKIQCNACICVCVCTLSHIEEGVLVFGFELIVRSRGSRDHIVNLCSSVGSQN